MVRQRDIKAAVRAVTNAGFPLRELRVGPDGSIIVVAGTDLLPSADAAAIAKEVAEWERLIAGDGPVKSLPATNPVWESPPDRGVAPRAKGKPRQ
ncbi:hypothetical protein [Bradyrhizobium sp. LA6.12]|uniref:hypothetical protein n=1 Tax=unclassified Bradyrhizobium TaxID=2631580 RepID=UPI0033978117